MENRRHLLRLRFFPERTERWILMMCGIDRLEQLDTDDRAAERFDVLLGEFKAGDRAIKS